MLLPKRINYRRRAHHRNVYTIGSPEFIEKLYDKVIRDAEKEGKIEEVKFLRESKKIALRRAENKRSKNNTLESSELPQMQ